MAGEENNTVTETVPLNVDDVAQIVNVVADTASLKDGERSDDVAVQEESVLDREKQAIVPEMNDLASVEGDDVAAGDSSSVKVIRKYGRRKKKPGRKSNAEIEKEKMKEAFENGTKEETSKGDDEVAAGESISVHASADATTPAKKRRRNRNTEKENETGEGGGFSSVGVRKSERPRKIKSLKEDYVSDLEEDVKKKGKRGRKKKVIIGASDENDAAEEEGENVKTEKKKPGRKRKEIFSSGDENEAEKEEGNVKKEKQKPGRKKKISSKENDEDEQEGENGRNVKIEENELISEKNSESAVLSDDTKGYSLRTDRKAKVKSIEQAKTASKRWDPKVTSHDLSAYVYVFEFGVTCVYVIVVLFLFLFFN